MKIERGFTLIELVVTITLITAALLGPLVVISNSFPRLQFSKQKLIALHLAQEGVELVRAIRENNILCDFLDGGMVESNPWNRNPNLGIGALLTNATIRLDATENISLTPPGVCTAIKSPKPLPPNATLPLKFDIDPLSPTFGYNYANGADTIFRREVIIQSPPIAVAPDPATDTPVIPSGDQMDVIVTVRWATPFGTQQVQLYERFYRWR